MISTKQFLDSFTGSIEFSDAKSLIVPTPESKCYFLAGWGEKPSRRARGVDIIKKNYFTIDLDIRKDVLYLTGEIMPDEEIFEIADILEKILEESPIFKDWRYVVFSGNGLHIYYIQENPLIISQQEYKLAMKRIQKLFKNETDCQYIIPDPKCVNIDRIMRLPGTTNDRSAYNIGSTKCRVIKQKPYIYSPLLADFEKLAKLEEQIAIERAEELKKKTQAALKKLPKDDREKHEKALSIPIEMLFDSLNIIQHRGFVNGKNWIDPRDGSLYGFHKYENSIICEGSTTFAPYCGGKGAVNNISLVRNVKNCSYNDAVEYILNLLK